MIKIFKIQKQHKIILVKILKMKTNSKLSIMIKTVEKNKGISNHVIINLKQAKKLKFKIIIIQILNYRLMIQIFDAVMKT